MKIGPMWIAWEVRDVQHVQHVPGNRLRHVPLRLDAEGQLYRWGPRGMPQLPRSSWQDLEA